MTEKIPLGSSWRLPPTGKQCEAITRLCMIAGVKEELELKPSTRLEARNQIYDLRLESSRRRGRGIDKVM